jgi:hypothetical protein
MKLFKLRFNYFFIISSITIAMIFSAYKCSVGDVNNDNVKTENIKEQISQTNKY